MSTVTEPQNNKSVELDLEAKRLANQSRVLFNELIGNTIRTRSQLLQRAMDPRRDLNEECGYPDHISLEDYQQMYDREGIGSRVVAVWPRESWTQDPDINENEDSELTEFERAWRSLESRFNLFHYLARVDELSGIGSFGIILLGLNDGASDLSQPVKGIELEGPRTGMRTSDAQNNSLLYVRVFGQSHVQVAETDADPTSPRYGQPNVYTVVVSDPNSNVQDESHEVGKTIRVHWTRVVHIADNRKSSEIYGMPRMQQVWNRLMDLRKLLGGSAEMFWKGAFPGYSFETHPELGEVDVDISSLKKEFAEFSNGLNRFLATSGITAKSMAPQVADPEAHVLIQIRAIALTIEVPWRVFLGSEQAQLASDQDRDNFNKRIAVRREKYLTPNVVRPFVDRLILLGILPAPADDPDSQLSDDLPTEVGSFNYEVVWPDVDKMSQKEQADWIKTITEAVARYIQSGMSQLIPEQVFLTRFLGLEDEEAEAILEEAEALLAALDDEDDTLPPDTDPDARQQRSGDPPADPPEPVS